MPDPKSIDKESLRVEYDTAQQAYIHYDNFSWQVGAVLIAGVFVFWGFLLGGEVDSRLFLIGSLLVVLLMSVWELYSHHNRQIYLCKLHRIHEIEKLLDCEQHRRWLTPRSKKKPIYRTFGPHGHQLDTFIYIIVSLGAPLISFIKLGPSLWLVLPVFLVIFVLFWVNRNERAIKKYLREI